MYIYTYTVSACSCLSAPMIYVHIYLHIDTDILISACSCLPAPIIHVHIYLHTDIVSVGTLTARATSSWISLLDRVTTSRHDTPNPVASPLPTRETMR